MTLSPGLLGQCRRLEPSFQATVCICNHVLAMGGIREKDWKKCGD